MVSAIPILDVAQIHSFDPAVLLEHVTQLANLGESATPLASTHVHVDRGRGIDEGQASYNSKIFELCQRTDGLMAPMKPKTSGYLIGA